MPLKWQHFQHAMHVPSVGYWVAHSSWRSDRQHNWSGAHKSDHAANGKAVVYSCQPKTEKPIWAESLCNNLCKISKKCSLKKIVKTLYSGGMMPNIQHYKLFINTWSNVAFTVSEQRIGKARNYTYPIQVRPIWGCPAAMCPEGIRCHRQPGKLWQTAAGQG